MVDREVRVRLSVVGSSQFNQQMQQAGQGMQNLGQGSGQVDKAGSSITGFIKKAAAVVGVGAAIKSTAKTFGDFQQSLNRFQQVSGATADQMNQVTVKAREVGKAVAGMSSSDAADAMLELAKGGLTADEAMQAVTGTVNLAAAAQVSAAEAAEIQSKALNTFGLKASDANRVADVLANTANAASGDIGDFAQALQQVGPSAAQLGISIEDTNTALGLFANNGILGSDAGTSLKTMLQRLNPTSKQAAAAMKSLGVNAFDAQGNFVGLQTVSEQLQAAQASMTQQQFSAAAAVAFGSDAVRGASVLAKEGGENFTAFGVEVAKAGGASAAAEANTKGLNGAIDAVKAAVEDAQIALGEKLAPSAEALGHKLSDLIPVLARQLAPALEGIGDAAISGADIAATALGTIVKIATPVIDAIASVTAVFTGLPAPIQTAALALGALILMRNRVKAMATGINGAFRSATASAGLFGRQMQFLRFKGMSGLGAAFTVAGARVKGFARSLSGAFGGPIGLAILGITTAISFFAGKNAEAAQKAEEHAQAISDLAGTMDQATGAITEASSAAIRSDFGNVQDAFEAVGLNAGEAANAIIKMADDSGKAAQEFRQKVVDKMDFGDIGKRLSVSGAQYVNQWHNITHLAQTDILEMVARGGPALEELKTKLIEGGVAPDRMTDGINRLRGDMENVSSTFSAFTGQQEQMALALGVTAGQVKTNRQAFAQLAGVNFDDFNAAMERAAKSGGSLETALYSLGLNKTQAAAVIAKMGDAAHVGGAGMHYLTQEAADSATAAVAAGSAADGASPKIDGIGNSAQVAGDKMADGEEGVTGFAKALEDAKPPADGLKGSIDLMKSATDELTTASDLMAAAVLRAAGVDLTAEQQHRENAAAMRGVTQGIYEKKRATEDDTLATRDRKQAEEDYNTAVREGRKKNKDGEYTETQEEYAGRLQDASDKVADSKRREQDAHLKNAEAQTADKEAYEKAATSALDMATGAGLAALATGDVTSASKVAQTEIGKQRKAFIDAAVAAGISKDAASKLADQYGLTPKAVDTAFNAHIDEAEKNGSHLVRVYDTAKGQWTASFLTDGEIAAQVAAGTTVQAYDRAKGTWSATITADNASAMDAINETNRAQVYDKSFSIYENRVTTFTTRGGGRSNSNPLINDARAFGGLIPGLAGGGFNGVLPGPRAPRGVDNMLGLVRGKKPVALAGKEFVVNPEATAKNLPLLYAINSGKMQRAATGALIGRSISESSAQLMRMAMPTSGTQEVRVLVELRGDGVLTDAMAREAGVKIGQALDQQGSQLVAFR